MFYVSKKKFLQEKNGILDMGVPILGGGSLTAWKKFPRGKTPPQYGNFFDKIPFFSEDVPK